MLEEIEGSIFDENIVYVDRAALAAHNAEMERLEAEVRELRALRLRIVDVDVWQPVDDFQESDEAGVLLTVNDNTDCLDYSPGTPQFSVILETIRGESTVLGYDLPDDIRLCRKVKA